MQSLTLKHSTKNPKAHIQICGSKSESNRLLIINALYDQAIALHNLSDAQDTDLLLRALNSKESQIDIHHAGTAMRFLTAFFAIQDQRNVILTGSERMKQRPIGILVDALRSLGASIAYLEKEGFPPLKIHGKKLTKNHVRLDAHVSSQFITALLLIAPKLENGLKIELIGKITSLPYLMMTISMMKSLGFEIDFQENIIQIQPKSKLDKQSFTIESDWSSASYFYSIAALSENPEIQLSAYKSDSLQGDAELQNIYKTYFGIQTQFQGNSIRLTKDSNFKFQAFHLDLNSTPDTAQTIAVTCAGLNLKCKLTGLETLKNKETDRLVALQNELQKVGTKTIITEDSLEIVDFENASKLPQIETYNDHRMAMAFAPLYKKMDLEILNPSVVEKSYPQFWEDLYLL